MRLSPFIDLSAVDDPSLSQLSTAGLIFVALMFVGLIAAVAVPTWRRIARRRQRDERLRREARIAAAEEPGLELPLLRAAVTAAADERLSFDDVQIVSAERSDDRTRFVAAVDRRGRGLSFWTMARSDAGEWEITDVEGAREGRRHLEAPPIVVASPPA